MKQLAKAIGVFLFLQMTAISPAKDGDWQQWTESRFATKITDELSTSFRYEQRLEEDASKFALNIFEQLFNWQVDKTWDVHVGYRRTERYEPVASANNDCVASAVMKVPLTDEMTLSNRFRFQFVVPEGINPWHTIYRNRTDLRAKLEIQKFKFEPFLFEEWFINIDDGQLDQNRAAVGVGFPITEELTADFSFMRLDRKTSKGWEWHPVGLVSLKVNF